MIGMSLFAGYSLYFSHNSSISCGLGIAMIILSSKPVEINCFNIVNEILPSEFTVAVRTHSLVGRFLLIESTTSPGFFPERTCIRLPGSTWFSSYQSFKPKTYLFLRITQPGNFSPFLPSTNVNLMRGASYAVGNRFSRQFDSGKVPDRQCG